MEMNKLSVKFQGHIITLISTHEKRGVDYSVRTMAGTEILAGFSVDGTPDSLLGYVKNRLRLEIETPTRPAYPDLSKDSPAPERGRK